MKIIFNPFEKFRENQLLTVGAVGTVIGSLLGFLFNGRFDGILDLHFVAEVEWYVPFVDNIINILVASLVFFLLGYLLNKKTRFVDCLAFSLIARVPLYLLTLFNAGGTMFSVGDKVAKNIGTNPLEILEKSEIIIMSVFGIMSILIMVWHIALLYNGFRVSTNGKGVKAVLLFIVAIIVAEIVSKVIITSVYSL
jgi:hypothetical protein